MNSSRGQTKWKGMHTENRRNRYTRRAHNCNSDVILREKNWTGWRGVAVNKKFSKISYFTTNNRGTTNPVRGW
ncbi:hypothetical protein POVCU1_019400 [Plasmodium ovale curtisi]|nr:hypothetical protein POVCU1_019400 [Plasmodium ovale curtisi]